MAEETTLEVLDSATCRRLLESEPIGWLAHCFKERSHIVPVNFTLHGGEVIIEAGYGRSLQAAAQHQVMTLAAGALDSRTESGWSVTVSGRAHLLGDELVNPNLPRPRVWVPLESRVAIAIPVQRISGRQMAPTSQPSE